MVIALIPAAVYCVFTWGYAVGNLVGESDHGLTPLACILVVVFAPVWLTMLVSINTWDWLTASASSR